MPADQKLQSHTYSRVVEKFKKCYSEQGCQKFWSSRLIINSRWLWNLHQRHKFLRAEAFRDVLKFIESQKWRFQEFLRGISTADAMLFCQNTHITVGTLLLKCPRRFMTLHSSENRTCLNMRSMSFKTGKQMLYNNIWWCLFFVSSYGRRRWK